MKIEDFKKTIERSLDTLVKDSCGLCPYRDDDHLMNCHECCPAKRAIKDKVNLSGY